MSFIVIIPARFASTRLPGKALADINGKPLVVHVLQRARESTAARIIVATDHPAVVSAVEAAGGEACLTREDHQSGTERLTEVIERYQFAKEAIIVNVQGDEPLLPPALIQQVANNLANHDVVMATLAAPIVNKEDAFNTNVVKVVRDYRGNALYFSRATIPWDREKQGYQASHSTEPLLRHIGLYAYRAEFIQRYVATPVSPLERIEMLEQLRVLWIGEKIHVDIVNAPPPAGVDTEEDLDRVRALLTP